MPNQKKNIQLNIETLVLVAVWEKPFIFQGCIKITELDEHYKVLYFFRCESHHTEQQDILHKHFSSNDYQLTHLYNESGLVSLNSLTPTKEYALDMMKYALHVTLKEMLSNRKIHFTSIDDIAMQAMINKIKPILNNECAIPEEEHIGFAVAMDFSPQEEMGQLAALALLKQLESPEQSH